MRSYDVAYVKNGPYNPYPVVPLQEMTLEDIKKKYIKMCAKANGDVSVCSKCQTPCPEGKRAIQLIANNVYSDPPVPLYGGKTLIERAREDNMKRRAELEKAEKEKKEAEQKPKRTKVAIEDWFNKAMATDDPIQWIMDNLHVSKTKAKQKIYDYRYRHPEVKANDKITKTIKPPEKHVEEKEVKTEDPPKTNERIESKLESLMRQQEEQKKAMNEYFRLYEQAKVEYEKIKQKTDVLCNALDIMNE